MTKDSNPHHAARSSAASVPSALVLRYEAELKLVAEQRGPILDLACGRGRNGLHLAQQGAPVVFADNDATALEDIQQQLAAEALSKQYCRCWQVDLETEADAPLEHNEYSAIMVFRYLHRPLFGSIKQALVPGGLLVYETFTRDRRNTGALTIRTFYYIRASCNGSLRAGPFFTASKGPFKTSPVIHRPSHS